MHFAHGIAVSQPGEASSKRQGDGQRIQKKAMKTTHLKIEASAPANVRPSSVSKTSNSEPHQIDFRQKFQNRQLSTEKLLDMQSGDPFM
jgi:hypothetical protein